MKRSSWAKGSEGGTEESEVTEPGEGISGKRNTVVKTLRHNPLCSI